MSNDLLTTGSILAAFFAGSVALFAPCCIVFLAPSYMAVAVKNRRWRLLPLTFMFAAGLGLVLVPITLGIGLLAGTITKYHAPLYYTGGALMLTLAAFTLSGRMWSMPLFLRAPETARGDSASFFSLGVFSGIASSCCAPVLVGVMTLSALSGSAVGGVTLGLAFTFGMTFPLFVMALVWDRFHLGERRWLRAKAVRIHVAGRTIATNTINIGIAVAFAAMGGFVFYLATTETTMSGGSGGSAGQVATSKFLVRIFGDVAKWTSGIPEAVLGLFVLALASVFIIATLRGRRANPTDTEEHDEPSSCHEQESTTEGSRRA